MKIEIKLPALSRQRPLNITQSFIELNNDNLRYCVEFVAEEWINNEDESLGTKEESNFLDFTVFKRNISGVELSLSSNPNRYLVLLPIIGCTADIKIFFKKREEAQALTDTIKEWLFN